ncbi:MAG: DmsC/YnfH family molybdoenzyme membrane anchor subunit [Paracoccaceae bacterium]|nr:DmsC/YnfH family molybdoenzyme membrane anchor subunit [Paracoccaceae bacterium]
MHPAPSVILFTVLSGLGFGFLGFLALGQIAVQGWAAFWLWGLGYALAVGGLLASAFHLGNPQRAWRAFTQWRSSWLSREAWASLLTLVILAPVALGDWLGFAAPFALRLSGAVLCAVTVLCTAMIYTQIRAVPRWNHWITPVMFLAFALTGGALLAGLSVVAAVFCAALGVVLLAGFAIGDRQFAARGATIGTATGLGGLGAVRAFEWPHTGDNYLLREMIFVVGRRHAARLRLIAVGGAAVLPGMLVLVLPAGVGVTGLAVALHLFGAFAARWLFFAQAEHVVGLYYGRR